MQSVLAGPLMSLALLQVAVADPTVTIACPKRIAVAQRLDQAVQSPWQAIDRSDSYPFTNVTFYGSHPREMAALVPDSERKTPRGATATWRFDGSREFWMTCDYSLTDVSLAIPIDKSLSSCTATYDPHRSTPVVIKVECVRKP